jgi:hypothetical protein
MLTIEEKYQRYMDNIKKANKKYIETHKDEVNAKRRNYYREKMSVNEDYKNKKSEYNKKLYQKKKLEKIQETLGKSE